jgi:uncharacterized damage-inducible protein DinB
MGLSSPMARRGVRELLSLLDEAFAGAGIEESGESQALMTNLATVDEATWRRIPPGMSRTVESMVLHVGSCKVMYVDHAFRDATLSWEDASVQPWPEGSAPMAEALSWLARAHDELVRSVAPLQDADLDAPRRTNWGEMRPTRWIIAALIGHDFYHAGEVNHLRSLLSGDDRWRWQRELEGGDAD